MTLRDDARAQAAEWGGIIGFRTNGKEKIDEVFFVDFTLFEAHNGDGEPVPEGNMIGIAITPIKRDGRLNLDKAFRVTVLETDINDALEDPLPEEPWEEGYEEPTAPE